MTVHVPKDGCVSNTGQLRRRWPLSGWRTTSEDVTKQRPFRWLIYDNNGSYNGYFDWLPLWMRVGYWSPVTILFVIAFYVSMITRKPSRLEFAMAIQAEESARTAWWTCVDTLVFVWGVVVLVYAKRTMDNVGALFMSYTGWSWTLLTARAGCEAAASLLSSVDLPDVAGFLALVGSALRFPAAVAAVITFTVWNFVLLPLIGLVATPRGKRKNFLKFNFGFLMTNVHMVNLPLALVGNVWGPTARLFTTSDLWIGYLIVMMYSILYLFVMDRLGLHFYPVFCPRSAFCGVSFGLVLYLYYDLLHRGNAVMPMINPHLAPVASE